MDSNGNKVPHGLGAIDKRFPATSASLLAASFYLDSACKAVNDMFMQCRLSSREDPIQCAGHSASVLNCSKSLFERIQKSPCLIQWQRLIACYDMNNQKFIYCRSEEFDFDRCARNNLSIGKDLWRGWSRESGGLKGERERGEDGSWGYSSHVWFRKKAYKVDNVAKG